MSLRLLLTKSAENDLDRIAKFIQAENPAAAAQLVRDVRRRLQQLTEFPHTGRARDDLRPGARTLAFDRRLTVIYKIGTGVVRILRIHYRGRDIRGR